MKIIELKEEHPRIYAWALACQVEQGNAPDDQKDLRDPQGVGNFTWDQTVEGRSFWSLIDLEKYHVFYDRYPEQLKLTELPVDPVTKGQGAVSIQDIVNKIVTEAHAQFLEIFNKHQQEFEYAAVQLQDFIKERRESFGVSSKEAINVVNDTAKEIQEFAKNFTDKSKLGKRQDSLAKAAQIIGKLNPGTLPPQPPPFQPLDGPGSISEYLKSVDDAVAGPELSAPAHYDNSKGSLYFIAQQRGWNPYIFDVVKRLERGGKKDPLKQEIEKSIFVLQLWLKEHEQKENAG